MIQNFFLFQILPLVIVSLAIATTVLHLDSVSTRQLAQLETTATIQLRRATDLALQALKTVQKMKYELTKGGAWLSLKK